ncbi:MAG TPA: TolC family protein [Gemmatimonadales bacterium]|nr:TolC family protein [Gemmatimonadales bacterium]
MTLALLAALQLAADSIPVVTLGEALRAAARADPGYVAAVGALDNAEWGRRAAWSTFVLPAVSVSADYSVFSTSAFNFGTFRPSPRLAVAAVEARYDLFTGGQKMAALRRAQAEVEAAAAGTREARFALALATEADYYAVLADEELARVAAERVRRAEEQFAVARARVLSGAAVQTDSLQLLLEVKRARVARLDQESALRVSRLQLGRRIGLAGPARAAPLDTAPPPAPPFPLEEAVRQALAQGPAYRVARANERAAAAELMGRRGAYLPRVTLSASMAAFDERFFPQATRRNTLSLGLSFPIWDSGQREIALSRARVNRDVARALRQDLERAAWRDVTAAYEAYTTSREAAVLAAEALAVARENYRVQDTRYRSGATTILDLIDAQLGLAEAEAALVQARFGTRLALAGLEAMLGVRLDPSKDAP